MGLAFPMNWRLRILRGTAYSLIPFGAELRKFKRRLFTATAESPNTRFAIADGLRQIAALKACGADLTGSVLEIGTGWLPVIPLLFHMAGSRHLVLTDTERLMDATTIEIAKNAVLQRLPSIAADLALDLRAAREALDRPFNPEYHAPVHTESLQKHSIDIAVSRCVFEHIRPDLLTPLVASLHHVVQPNGWMCHIVDNSDHWQHIHPARSRVEFLSWRHGSLVERFARLNNYGYTNRLRHSDYVVMFRGAGWDVVMAEGQPDRQSLADLRRLRIAREFSHYDPVDLATLDSCFVARKLRADPGAEAAL